MLPSAETYCYIKLLCKFYWKEKKKFFSPAEVCSNLMCTQKELNEKRQEWKIKTYDNICYCSTYVHNHLNLLDDRDILKPSDIAKLDDSIKHLVENLCWYKKENIDYLHKAILYKYENLDDFNIPCIVLYWKWWSWKWTLMSLLATIFWEDNVLVNLWQRELQSQFDTYKWQKLVVEFAEITTQSIHWDKIILNKLKNIIWAQKLTINEKWVKQYQIENSAWFFISSNSNTPLRLDDKDKWNRRFSVIKSNSSLQNWEEINKKVKNKEIVSNYLAWLYVNYWEVQEYMKMLPLDNQDKKELEERTQEESNNFWEWVFENHNNFKWKKSIQEIYPLINMFCIENNLDEKEFLRYFWNNSKYSKKKLRVWDKTFYGVEIE